VKGGADLNQLVVETRELAAARPRSIPREALAVAADAAAWRRFSFSSLSGALTVDRGVADEIEGTEDRRVGEPLESHIDGANAQEFGALVHAILERVDFSRPGDARDWADFLAPHYVNASPERTAAAAGALVERFLQTPLAAEIAAAPIVRREVEFLLPWPPAPPKSPRGAGPYLHGFIDCLYQDAAGRWRLIDYKTNPVAATEVSRVAAAYKPQLLAYRLACEQALGQSLAECTLVLLHAGVTQPLEWNAAEERRGIAAITDAIAALAST
jgi:ATP-dependent exoDNAse (exonuclease V) beta subunit